MSPDFVRFPVTPYLRAPSGVDVRQDKVFSSEERREFLAHELRVEEKVDGQNLGISSYEGKLLFQARGSYVEPGGRHFRGLATWAAPRATRIAREIGPDLVLFGEWCADAHSVRYDRLPDWFLLFDVLERPSMTFWGSALRDELAQAVGLCVTPLLTCGTFTESGLLELLGTSRLGSEPMEGVLLRLERDEAVKGRAKFVRPDFVQAISEHWMDSPRRPNRLAR